MKSNVHCKFMALLVLVLVLTSLDTVAAADADQDICPGLHNHWSKHTHSDNEEYIQMTVEEYESQEPFYVGKSVNDIIALCRLPDGSYDFTAANTNCIANTVVNIQDDKRRERIREERRVQLCDAITKVISFKARLESPGETVIQFVLFFIALICGLILIAVGHFRIKTMFDRRFPDPTKGWPFWIYQKMSYYVVPVGKETKGDDSRVSEKIAHATARGREWEIDDVIGTDDEKEDIMQAAAAVTEYADFWNIFNRQHGGGGGKGDSKNSSKKPQT